MVQKKWESGRKNFFGQVTSFSSLSCLFYFSICRLYIVFILFVFIAPSTNCFQTGSFSIWNVNEFQPTEEKIAFYPYTPEIKRREKKGRMQNNANNLTGEEWFSLCFRIKKTGNCNFVNVNKMNRLSSVLLLVYPIFPFVCELNVA